jgi:hypothetical protein
MNLGNVVSQAMGDITNRRLQNLYQRDFVAWRADVLGYRSYDLMDEICNETLFGKIRRTAIKSSNGTSKSHEFANMIAWAASVFDVGEALSIVTAPSVPQLEATIFRYMKSAKVRAAQRGFDLRGTINESLEWEVKGPEGNIPLVIGRVPSTGSEVSRFQGVRSQTGRTYVWADEAGGLSKNIFTAIEAIITGKEARLGLIGNPDDVGTEWHRIFTDPKYDGDFNRFSISSFQLPTFTGEVVYPDDPEMEARMLASLTQVDWVERQKRIWGENDPRYLSKVMGEFPKDGGNGFFPMSAIGKAHDTTIEEDIERPLVIGADIARWGQDESVIAACRGGRVRVVATWGKTDLVDTARRIHKYAQDNLAAEVRIDTTGVGGGVYDMLDRMDEFSGKVYLLVGWDNGRASPDPSQWSNMRSYSHDSLRTQMVEGFIDLDYEDDILREELQAITFKFNNRGAIQITPKDDLKTALNGRSPDRLDAVIMAATDMSPWTGNPYNQMPLGSVISMDRSEIAVIDDFAQAIRGPGMPMYW